MNKPSDKPSIDQLARKLAESVPAGLRTMRDELEQNFRSVLRTSLGKLDLVTREEFEVQQLVLARTREKLEALETRLQAMGSAPAGRKKSSRKKTASTKKPGDGGEPG